MLWCGGRVVALVADGALGEVGSGRGVRGVDLGALGVDLGVLCDVMCVFWAGRRGTRWGLRRANRALYNSTRRGLP